MRMQPGGRAPSITMADVAERAGVSRALVSIVFRGAPGASPESRERVMRAAEELSYRPDRRARLLGSSRSRTVGVIFGLHREFHAELVEWLYQALDGTGFELALGATAPSRDERTAVQSMLEFRCEALVLVGPTLPVREIEELAGRVPVVVVARSVRSRTLDVVRTDDQEGARIAVHHLAGLGHQRIVHVDGGRAPGAAQRRRGYRDAMAGLGLADRAGLVPGGLTDEDGERAAGELLAAATRATAVTAFNDHCAAGLLAAVRKAGVAVPDELSLVGYDDSHVAGLSTVALTTIAQDSAAMARAALELALARTEEAGEPPREVVVPPRLVVRLTTGAPGQRSTSVVS